MFRRFLRKLVILVIVYLCTLNLMKVWQRINPPFTKGHDRPASYVVLFDDKLPYLAIGVDADITRKQLCATLAHVADVHQFDGRDYWWFCYLRVDAYLMKDGQRSGRAGTLRRYIPILNSEYKGWLELMPLLFGKDDDFSTHLWFARHKFE
jgi:hypothetical protein